MNKKHIPIAALANVAELHETFARRADRQEHFAMRLQAAFPSLWQHAAITGNDTIITVAQQWDFSLDGVEFCIIWHSTQRGAGYWLFHAWDEGGKHTTRDTGSYHTPDPDTALLCFVGAALRQARALEGVA